MTDAFRDLIHADQSEGTAVREAARYFVDTQWYDAHGRSFRAMAQARFCTACQAKIGTTSQERLPTVDRKTNRVVYEVRDVHFGDQPMAVIRSCCSKQRNFITAETPLLEAIFRVFLANGNQPATIDRVREQLGDWISLRDRPHGYSTELVEHLIRHDTRYGLREFALASG